MLTIITWMYPRNIPKHVAIRYFSVLHHINQWTPLIWPRIGRLLLALVVKRKVCLLQCAATSKWIWCKSDFVVCLGNEFDVDFDFFCAFDDILGEKVVLFRSFLCIHYLQLSSLLHHVEEWGRHGLPHDLCWLECNREQSRMWASTETPEKEKELHSSGG